MAETERLTHTTRLFWRVCLALGIVALVYLLVHLGLPQEGGVSRYFTSLKWRMAAMAGAALTVGLLAVLAVSWLPGWARISLVFNTAYHRAVRLGLLNLLPFLVLLLVFLSLVYQPLPGVFENAQLFQGLLARASALWLLAGAGAFFLAALFPSLKETGALVGALFIFMALYRIFTFAPDVSAFPFSLGWSEGSRYYYASLFDSQQLYGFRTPWSFLHPSRYLLQAIPFLAPALPLWFHRLWQVLLWLGMTGLTAFLLQRRLALPAPRLRWLAAGWAFFFLFQGPVYYHLLVIPAVMLWGFDPQRPVRSLLLVTAASIWAGISRVNWFPVPAMLAIALYVIETPYPRTPGFWRYWKLPLAFTVVGLAAALIGQAAYMALSGIPDPGVFASSFTSDLLWYRLLPSKTYPPGILPVTLGLSLPLLVLLVVNHRRRGWHPLRVLALAAMAVVLLAGGLVVSTKIGGGGNLHNLDAYYTLLLVWGSLLWAGRFAPDGPAVPVWSPRWLTLAGALLPLVPLLLEGGPLPNRDLAAARLELAYLQERVQAETAAGGRVLFIGQRHLLTFGLVDAPLEPRYELLELMEVAMSGNQAYLQQFYQDLEVHAYSLVIVDPQRTALKDQAYAFPEENNVWVEKISIPFLKYYRAGELLPTAGVQLYTPAQP